MRGGGVGGGVAVTVVWQSYATRNEPDSVTTIGCAVSVGTMAASSVNSVAGLSPRHFCAKRPTTQITGSGFDSCSGQHDFFLVAIGRYDLRVSTSGRTCDGGSMPLTSAHSSFSSSVKQQQSPFQHKSELAQPHGRNWQGYGADASDVQRTNGNGSPNATMRWLTIASIAIASRRLPSVKPRRFPMCEPVSPKWAGLHESYCVTRSSTNGFAAKPFPILAA